MSVQKLRPCAALSPVVLALAFAAAPAAADPVRDSFDRMLATDAPAAQHVVAAPGPADPLLAALVVPLRDGIWPARRVDPVAESFARLFDHEPIATAPPSPDDSRADPLIAAVVWPLLRSNQIRVAALAPHAVR